MLRYDIMDYEVYFEVLMYGHVNNDVINIFHPACYTDLPVGLIDERYYNDKKYSNVNILDYVREVRYYCYYNPISYENMQHLFHLKDECIELLEKYKCNLYEVTIIMGKNLKDMGGNYPVNSTECYPYTRLGQYRVQLTTPPQLLQNNCIITLKSSYPNHLYIIEGEGI